MDIILTDQIAILFIYLTNSIGQSSGLLNRKFGVQVPGGVPLLASPANCQKKRYGSEFTRRWPSPDVLGLVMLRVLYITLRGALRKAACRTGGLEGMTTTSNVFILYPMLYSKIRIKVMFLFSFGVKLWKH